jgi:hypothetical protein
METFKEIERGQRGGKKSASPLSPCQLRIPRALFEKMRARAAEESLPLATWIRLACLQELRRKKVAV